jgi:hypothetical protein
MPRFVVILRLLLFDYATYAQIFCWIVVFTFYINVNCYAVT